MTLLHSHPPATGTDIFHGCQFIFAHVQGIRLGGATETTFGFVSTRVAQVSRVFSYGTTILTSIGHDSTPFSPKALEVRAERCRFITFSNYETGKVKPGTRPKSINQDHP